MATTGHAQFATAIGTCGIAWNDCGLTRVLLPGKGLPAALSRDGGTSREAPPSVERVIAAIERLLAGVPEDLTFAALDLTDVPAFHKRVYELARHIRPGTTMTYGEVARALGGAGAARAVGQALGRNPFPIVVPCHRVVAARGRLGGFSAPGGADTKLRMLAIEGVAPATLPLFGR